MIHGDSGDVYIGNWLNDKAHGKGTYHHASSGAVYEGDWVNDSQEGFGTERWPDGTEYTGWFKGGMKHGRGTLTVIDPVSGENSRFEGDFKEN